MRWAGVRLSLLGTSLAGASAWLVFAGGPSGGELQRAVNQAGWLAPLVFVVVYIGWTVLLLPGVVPTLAGGALFGIVGGSLLSSTGAVIGATVAYLIGRHLGRPQVERLAGRRLARFDEWMRRRGFLALLYARLVPIVPFNLLNYAAGLAEISTRSYVTATAVGIVPGTIAYTAVGSTASHPGSRPFIASLAAVSLLTLIVGGLSARSRRREAPDRGGHDELAEPRAPSSHASG
jgi:uncharacterized membrane protein YdjX (TVP38/TMEM64 family)